MTELPEEVLAGHRATLEAFVVRARRIEAHSLVADPDQFDRWAHCTMRVELKANSGTLTFEVPPEELFESLTTRCRPLLLKKERIHYPNVLGALKAFGKNHPLCMAEIENLRSVWRGALNPSAPILIGVAPETFAAPTSALPHFEVAEAWLYGDLVHADPARQGAVAFIPLDHRFVAAVVLYCQIVRLAVRTLNLLRQMQASGLVDLSQGALTDPVSVSVPLVSPIQGLRLRDAQEPPS